MGFKLAQKKLQNGELTTDFKGNKIKIQKQ